MFSMTEVAENYAKCVEDTKSTRTTSLFAFPAECNFSGFQPNLDFLKSREDKKVEQNSDRELKRVYVLLDAAKFAATSPLELNKLDLVDFVAISFYKIFGFPTGLGALVVRNTSAGILADGKKYFGGGTIAVVMATTPGKPIAAAGKYNNKISYRHKLKSNISERFEDGTLNYHGVIGLVHGFNCLRSFGSMLDMSRHIKHLTSRCFVEMSGLVHRRTRIPLCKFYGHYYDCLEGTVGSVIAFNLVDSHGFPIGYSRVEKLATLANIQMRTGCFCNPGACQTFLGISPEEVDHNYRNANKVCGDDNDLAEIANAHHGIPNKTDSKIVKPLGAVRVSFGYMSNIYDVVSFINFLKKYFLDTSTVAMETKSSCRPQAGIHHNDSKWRGRLILSDYIYIP